MTLYNKDGTVYKLAGPNPMMNDQKLWGDYQVHNMKWEDEKSEDETALVPAHSDFEVRDGFLSALEKAKDDIRVVESPPAAEETERRPVVQPDLHREELQATSEIEKTFIYCLPAKIRERRDSLYGDVYKTVQYGTPTSFEGVILEQSDLTIEVWTDAEIGVGSILYPKAGTKRWWRVQEKVAQAGGWVITAMPSDYQPSFET
jgi:hypothetical protein